MTQRRPLTRALILMTLPLACCREAGLPDPPLDTRAAAESLSADATAGADRAAGATILGGTAGPGCTSRTGYTPDFTRTAHGCRCPESVVPRTYRKKLSPWCRKTETASRSSGPPPC